MECPPQRVVQTSDVCFGWRRVEARVQAVERGAERAGDPISTKRSVCVWKRVYSTCVRCGCELCEGGVHLLSPVCVACPVCVSMVPLLSKAWKVLETALRKLANFATTHVCVARLNHRARGRLLT